MDVYLEHVSCDFCGSSKYKTVFRQPDFWLNKSEAFFYEFPVVRCMECGLLYVNPRPTRESMKFFYPTTYHDERIPEVALKRYQTQKKFIPAINPGSKLLDIGCAKGDWLHWLSGNQDAAFKAYGCDSFSGGIRNGYNIEFAPKELPLCEYPSDYFDLITAWAVLEHVHNPSSYFAEANRVMKDQGKFVFLVPNSHSLQVRYAFKDDIPRHIYQFSEKSVRRYAEKYNFTVESCIYTDELWPARGNGAAARTLWRWAGGNWADEFAKKSSRLSRKAYKLGLKIDEFLFKKNWEAKYNILGMMIITLGKKSHG